jgi:hypothetical protein
MDQFFAAVAWRVWERRETAVYDFSFFDTMSMDQGDYTTVVLFVTVKSTV